MGLALGSRSQKAWCQCELTSQEGLYAVSHKVEGNGMCLVACVEEGLRGAEKSTL